MEKSPNTEYSDYCKNYRNQKGWTMSNNLGVLDGAPPKRTLFRQGIKWVSILLHLAIQYTKNYTWKLPQEARQPLPVTYRLY